MLRIPEPLVTMAKSASPSSRLTVLPLAAVGEGVDLGGDVGVDDGGMWVGHHARTVGDPWLDLALDDDRAVRRMRGREVRRHGADDDQQRWNDDA